MSTIVFYDNHFRVLTKGAPETIKTLLKEEVENYDKVYTHYTRQGYRVLALAYKELDTNKINVDDVNREDLEFDLKFGGFFISDNPLKVDTKKNIESFKKSNFEIIMITGDNVLTAISIGMQLNLGKNCNSSWTLDYSDLKKYYWIDFD